MNQIYSELVANEFYASYGRSHPSGELVVKDLVHPNFKLDARRLYVILHTGIILVELETPEVIHLNRDRVLTLSPPMIRSLTQERRLTKRCAKQLDGLATRIESRLDCLTKTRMRELVKDMEEISMGRRSTKHLMSYTQEFWTYIYYEDSLVRKAE